MSKKGENMLVSIEVLTAPGCSKCAKAKQRIQRVVAEFQGQVDYQETDITQEPDRAVAFNVFLTPSIVINGQLEFEGAPKEEDLREKIRRLLDD